MPSGSPNIALARTAVDQLDIELTGAYAALDRAGTLHNQDVVTIASLNNQIRNAQTGKRGGIGLHLLPFVTDPNARPLLQHFQPSNTGDTKGGSAKVHGSFAAGLPTLDGIRAITVTPNYSYNNFFFGLNVVKGEDGSDHYEQITAFEVRDADASKCNAIETNWEHCLTMPDGLRYRFNQGTQVLDKEDLENGKKVSKVIRYYDISKGGWHTLAGIPYPGLGTGAIVVIVNEIIRTSNGMTFVAVTINGKRYAVGITTQPKATDWGPYLQSGYQMDVLGADAGKAPPAYTSYLRNLEANWAIGG